MIVLVAAALAGEPELRIERAVVALEEGRALDARALALDAGDDWRAHRLLVDASEAAGLGTATRAAVEAGGESEALIALRWREVAAGAREPGDVADLAVTSPELVSLALGSLALAEGMPDFALGFVEPVDWPEAAALRIRALVVANERRAAIETAEATHARWAHRPDLLAGLCDRAVRGRRLLRARDRLLEPLYEGGAASDDPLEVYRTRRVAVECGRQDVAAALGDRLAELGEARPELVRPPWSPVMRREMGRALATHKTPVLGPMSDDEAIDVVRSLAEELEEQGRLDLAVAQVDAVRERADAYELGALHARLLLGLDRHDDALAAANEALLLSVLPARDDASRLDARRLAREVSTSSATRGAVLHATGEREEAAVAFAIAAALDSGPEWARLRADVAAKGEWAGIEQVDEALAAAGAAETAADRLAAVDEALRELAFAPGADAFADGPLRARLAEAQRVRGDALRVLGRTDEALVAVSISGLIARTAPALRVRGELLEAGGHAHAAFVAYALAQGAGSSAGEALERTWLGPGDWEDAAVAVVVEGWQPLPPGPVVAQAGKPKLGAPLPPFSLDTAEGPITLEGLKGQVVVLNFWASWCAPCMVELPELAQLVRELRAEGHPVTVLAVSTDERVGDYERIARRSDLEGLVFSWNPELAAAFRVTGIPSTWVVDADGTARFHHTGFGSGSEVRLEREIRNLLR